MKKQYLMAGLMVAALGFTACDEDYTDWAEPQSNPQEEALAQIQASFATGINASIVMDDMAEIDSVEVLAFKSTSVEGASFSPSSLLINGEKFPYTYKSGSFTVALSQLDSLTQKTYQSRAAVARTMTVKANGTVVLNEQGLVVESNEMEISLTPATPPTADPEGYYIVGDFNEWASQKMEKVGDYLYEYQYVNEEGKDQYYKFQLGSYKDWDWQNGHVLGCAENGDASHSLFAVWGESGKEPGAAIANIKGKVIIQLDVENYRITVKDNNAPENIFMTGSAYEWGDEEKGGRWAPFVPINGTKGAFWGMYYFNADEQVKFAPQAGWGNDFGFSATISQSSIDRAGLSDNGGNIQVGKAGWYLVYVSVIGDERTVEFESPDVYLIGGTIGGWDATVASAKFEVPATADGEFISPAFIASDEVRAYVSMPEVSDWWKCEFMVFDGKIVYRGNGGDQDRVKAEAGQKLYLNFGTGTGSIK